MTVVGCAKAHAAGLPETLGIAHMDSAQQGLVDQHGRVATDLRVPLTDRCNLRCEYCMTAEGLDWLPSVETLTDTELIRLIGIGVELRDAQHNWNREAMVTAGETLSLLEESVTLTPTARSAIAFSPGTNPIPARPCAPVRVTNPSRNAGERRCGPNSRATASTTRPSCNRLDLGPPLMVEPAAQSPRAWPSAIGG